ncbi:MAG: hypothetical protein LBH01_03980 [Verrucomicrobiales bacterium]|jgi:hypothetical protein|nr:hypothetical protein [Verrucomicrobiales bacterium]
MNRKFSLPLWLKEARKENGYVNAAVELAADAGYSKAKFWEQFARGLYNRMKFRVEDHSQTGIVAVLPPPPRKKTRRGRYALPVLLLSLTVSALAACSGPNATPGTPCLPALPVDSPGTLLDNDQRNWVRNDEQLRQYTLNPYRDPNNPNLRHDGHNVQRLEQSADWNLRQNPPLDLAVGPVPDQNVPASVLNPVKAELEQKLAEQQKYMALIVEQNEQLLLRDRERQEQAAQMETLKAQTTDLQQQVGALHEQLDLERSLRVQDQLEVYTAKPWWKFWQ